MGNAIGGTKKKLRPIIIPLNYSSGFKTMSLDETRETWDEVSLVESDKEKGDAYFLQWKDRSCTEVELDLNNDKLKWFFTSDMSGCSLWYKQDKGRNTLTIRHEARPEISYEDEGFISVLKSDDYKVDLISEPKDDVLHKTARYAIVYAVIEDGEVTFHNQFILLKSVGKEKTYTLESVNYVSI